MLQTQKFAMNPMVFQSIKMMELPIIDLREKIEEELERNPALEVLEDRSSVTFSGFVSAAGESAANERQRFIEGALSHPETLQEHLLWQLRLQPIDAELRRICELLIQNLDEDGFHKEPVDLLLENEDQQRLKEALELIQRLDPAGSCAVDYMESLRIQIGLLDDAPKGILKALSHLELFERGKITEAAKKIGCTEAETRLILKKLKELSPFPGRQFSDGNIQGAYVIPDIQVSKKEGEFVIILNEEEIPVLGINPYFMKIAGNSGDKQGRDFARENIKEARWFINSINQRNHTLLRVSRAIVEFQRPFFTDGPKYLIPLTLRDIAGELGLHETTVSRTAHGKYMQTEWGIFELRHFFSNSISGTGSKGSRHSKEGVKETIREIIESEPQSLSDLDITGILEKRGITLARRTVAKYRNELALGSSFER